ncbi:MAG: hypothetical protein AB1791_17645, partial [Chloroflexota bacterium]
TVFPTLSGGYLPTAEPCGPPTIQAIDLVYVRGGPGPDYPITGGLAYLEVRPIAGRAADAAWWVIQLADGTLGWVADQVVNVHGYTGQVPIVASPPLNGQTPTPGPTWQPTPNPLCPPLPTLTPGAAGQGQPTAAATQIVAVATVSQVSPAATLVNIPTATPIVPPAPTATDSPTAAVAPVETTTTPAASSSNGLLYAGLVLLLGAVILALWRGRRRTTS